MAVNIEVAHKIEEMKKDGATDWEVGEKLGFSEKEILYARKVLGISSRISGGGKRVSYKAFDENGNVVAEGTAREIGRALNYTASAVRRWEKMSNPTYRLERVVE